jgi:hypothetical protein
MQQFKIRPDSFNEIRKKLILKIVPLMLLAAAGGLVISSANQPAGPNIYPFLIPFLALALFAAVYHGINRQKALHDSYIFIFEDNFVKREQLNTPTIAIPFSDVVSIKKRETVAF